MVEGHGPFRLRPAVCLYAAALLPFLPGTFEFLRRGIPDVLFAGDGAVLGTLHAAHGVQLLGPYSRFGWSHPGPAYFYLAAPIYSALALPFLLGNEWNPILPILPLVLLSLLAARTALGASHLLPWLAFVASCIIQTHVGFAPEAVALVAVALVGLGRRARTTSSLQPRWTSAVAATFVILWAFPLYETVTARPGNLQRLVAFFGPRHMAQHSLNEAAVTVARQMSVVPWAFLETIAHRPLAEPRAIVAVAIAIVQIAVVVLLRVHARKRGDAVLVMLADIAVVEAIVAVAAVQAIRGDIEFYLISWCAIVGLTSCFVVAGWLVSLADRWKGRLRLDVGLVIGSVVLLALSLSQPVTRGPVISQPGAGVERLARAVEAYFAAEHVDRPTLSVASRETWPSMVAVVLYLSKRGVPVYVEQSWLHVVGRQFAEAPGEHPRLLFGNSDFAAHARREPGLTQVAELGDTYVFR